MNKKVDINSVFESDNKSNKKGLCIIIPEDEQNIQEGQSLFKSHSSSEFQTPISDKNFGVNCLNKSLLKRIEEGTPLTGKQISNLQYDVEGINITDDLKVANTPNKVFGNYVKNPLNNTNFKEDSNFVNSYEKTNYTFTNKKGKINETDQNRIDNHKNTKISDNLNKNLNSGNSEEEFIFEKFGKRGWECANCNNFNFESRTKCNRCGINKNPKPISQIKYENIANKSENSKKILVERKGDWACPKCKNLNFSFRLQCNRCHLAKPPNLQIQSELDFYNEEIYHPNYADVSKRNKRNSYNFGTQNFNLKNYYSEPNQSGYYRGYKSKITEDNPTNNIPWNLNSQMNQNYYYGVRTSPNENNETSVKYNNVYNISQNNTEKTDKNDKFIKTNYPQLSLYHK